MNTKWTKDFDVSDCSDDGLWVAANYESIVERLKADRDYHAAEASRITEEHLDIDTSDDYSIEADTEESYHAGRVAALDNVLDLLAGREVKFFSETEA